MRFMSSNTDAMAASPCALVLAPQLDRAARAHDGFVARHPLGMRRGRHASRQHEQEAEPDCAQPVENACWYLHGGDYAAMLRHRNAPTTLPRGRHDEKTARHTVRRRSRRRQRRARIRQRARRSTAHRSFGRARRIVAQRDTSIPDRLMARAYGIAVIPNVVKVARGRRRPARQRRHGRARRQRQVQRSHHGLAHRRQRRLADRRAVHRHRAGVHHGARASRASPTASSRWAPMPRWPRARWAAPPRPSTDQNFTAEVYSYSRNRGLFAGIALDGSVLAIDSKSNKGLYGKTRSRLRHHRAPGFHRRGRRQAIRARHPRQHRRSCDQLASASNAKTAPDPAGAQGTEEPAAAPPAGATTFPMEDSQPGAEPPR